MWRPCSLTHTPPLNYLKTIYQTGRVCFLMKDTNLEPSPIWILDLVTKYAFIPHISHRYIIAQMSVKNNILKATATRTSFPENLFRSFLADSAPLQTLSNSLQTTWFEEIAKQFDNMQKRKRCKFIRQHENLKKLSTTVTSHIAECVLPCGTAVLCVCVCCPV